MNSTSPTTEFINSLASWAWLEHTAAGPVAFLLLAHPEADAVARELTSLADAIGLATPQQRLPDTGDRVLLTGDGRAAVHIDNCPHVVLVEVGPNWAEFTRTGGPIALIVGLAPLARNAPRTDVEPYLAHSTQNNQLRLGTAWAAQTANNGNRRTR